MATKSFSKESTILVSAPSNLTLEQSQSVTAELLRVAGHPTCFSGFKFQFIGESEAVKAHIAVGKDLKASAVN